ncbi:methionine gamma-lyase [Roseobacter sp. SK209-2-6]|uniref:methionine gamma-lyase n=1 Tax=Roseobacter sp. SK209-2-6 TaxID=388739 RepID=UPI0000F3C2B9|nr:methionine gamma-lyase [Roseobacter sp. SK209-2-6]EBA15416.1 methionine gamma-lyase [Roseobacter sp. SK209-2-6]
MTTSQGFATRAIHHGYDPQENEGALTPPIHMTSTFAFESAEAGGAMFAGEASGHFYSRISNPTLDLLEQRMATLEGAEAGLGTASGMGAITSTLWSLVRAGDEVIIDKTLYGCTFAFLTHGLTRFDVSVRPVDMTDPSNLEEVISDRTRVVYFETPANPNNRLVDIAAISKIAHRAGAKVVVDNTYATPVQTRPIEHGADIVVHSATKYLGGHGDLIAGIVVGSAEDITNIRLVGLKDMTGAVMAPMTAMLVMRGLKTLQLRVERHCKSALEVAQALEAHPAVAKVYYPGLASFEQGDLARRQMANFGGMIPFEVVGGKEGGIAFMNRLSMIQRAVSLGDAESLIQHPASMTHSTYTPEERAKHGIGEGLLRLSVGLEDVDDILSDLMRALGQHNSAAA